MWNLSNKILQKGSNMESPAKDRRQVVGKVSQLAEEFSARGFLVVREALTEKNLHELNKSVDWYMENYHEERIELSDSSVEFENILPKTSAFDSVIENPVVLDILRALIGESVTFEQFSIMIRNPTNNVKEFKGWHRDLTRDYSRRKEIDAISIIYYLTDVSENDHCFSIVPETHNRLINMKPEDVVPESEIEITGPAGTAVMFHAGCIHAGKLKLNSQVRRILQVYFSQKYGPRTAEWSDIPERLYLKKDPSLPENLYSKWNLKEVFDGTGKRPENIEESMSFPAIVKEVQKRTKS